MQNGNAVDEREDAAMAGQDARLEIVAAAAVKQGIDERQAAAAIRAAKEIQRGNVHVRIQSSDFTPSSSSGDSSRPPIVARRKYSVPSHSRASSSSTQVSGM